MFSVLLVANRGEIACRIIRAAKDLGVRTVAVYSDADRRALHVALADQAVHIGPADAASSYLNADAILTAARESGAEAIHPGYGFLSENAGFAAACAAAGLVFVGPPPDAIRAMGAKDTARNLMEAAGVPVVPGHDGDLSDNATLAQAAADIGYPVIVKAALGGGGKGMRRVEAPDQLADAIASARREAEAAFGDGRLFIEKYIASARHIEIQVFADRAGQTVHLFERDCSLQRRHQKVIEEAPAPGMTPGLRGRMTDAAVSAARAARYEGAGTVEFIVDASNPLHDETPFYFLEMNTRLQVEHPVTEFVTGQDLVAWQLRVAAGEPLPLTQSEIGLDGHAIEARLYAEDPMNGFLPSTGPLLAFEFTDDDSIRVDTGVRPGDVITPFYDPMIAKVIVGGSDRHTARSRLITALTDATIAGPRSNQAFLVSLLKHPAFRDGAAVTGLIDRDLDGFLDTIKKGDGEIVAAGIDALLDSHADQPEPNGPWDVLDGFQLGPDRRMEVDALADGEPLTALVEWRPGSGLTVNGIRAGSIDAQIFADGDDHVVVRHGRQIRFRKADPSVGVSDGAVSGHIVAPMPGRVAHVSAVAGDRAAKGDTLVVVEAMKMEHALRAPFDGTVAEVAVATGDQVEQGALLVVLEPLDDA